MEIKLFIEDKEKTFTVPFVKGRMLRRVIEINKKYDLNNMETETLDILANFVVECFEGQFTQDEFYDGIAADKLMDTVLDIIYTVQGITLKGNTDPNLQKG